MIETFTKKKLEIVLERPLLNRLLDLLDRLEVSGYTALPALAGRGHDGVWRREGMVGEAGQMIVVFCILDGDRIDAVLSEVRELITRQIGIVTVTDVEVVRRDHF